MLQFPYSNRKIRSNAVNQFKDRVNNRMGHSSLAVTSKYGHMKADTFEAVNRTLGGDKSGDSVAVRH